MRAQKPRISETEQAIGIKLGLNKLSCIVVLGDIEKKTQFNYCLPKYCNYYDYGQQNMA